MCPGSLTAGTNPQKNSGEWRVISGKWKAFAGHLPLSTCHWLYDAACTHGPGVSRTKKISPLAAELSAWPTTLWTV